MKDTMELSCVPCDESCEPLGPNYNPDRAIAECKAFRSQLRRQFGSEPSMARLYIASNPHDFGTYHEVAIRFDDDSEVEVDYAYNLEANLPETWDDEARQELGL